MCYKNIRVLRCVLDYHLEYYLKSGPTTKERSKVSQNRAREVQNIAEQIVTKKTEILTAIHQAGIKKVQYTQKLNNMLREMTTVIYLFIYLEIQISSFSVDWK